MSEVVGWYRFCVSCLPEKCTTMESGSLRLRGTGVFLLVVCVDSCAMRTELDRELQGKQGVE